MWPLIKYVPKKTNLRFVSVAIPMAFVSAVLVIGSLVSIFTQGFNLGVDFRGGTILEVRAAAPISTERLGETIRSLGIGDVTVQNIADNPNAAFVRFETPDDSDPARLVDQVKTEVRAAFPGAEFPRTEVVGARVSAELLFGGLTALGLALLLIMAYIWFRFEWQFGLGAILSLAHDVILTLGLFSVLQIEFNLVIVAALLTIIGYSINDSVVVFDRVRENLRKYKKMPLRELIDLSTNETLSRTIITGVTALMALTSLFLFGGEALEGFSIALIFGIIVGTYSSVYVGTPVILLWGVKRGESQEVIAPNGKQARGTP
jgi:preprotein translocase SecF subunit